MSGPCTQAAGESIEACRCRVRDTTCPVTVGARVRRAGLRSRRIHAVSTAVSAAGRPGAIGRARPNAPRGRRLRGYVALMKLRVVELLLVTTVPVMILAAHGVPNLLVVSATLVGGTLCAGAANAFNMVIDRDIDRVMHRTRHRPLVTGDAHAAAGDGVRFALTSSRRSSSASARPGSPAALSLGGDRLLRLHLHDVAQAPHPPEHHLGRPRRLLPGADRLGRGHRLALAGRAWVLFAVIFLWTPPHYWPLSMRYSEDYASVERADARGRRAQPKVGLQTVLYAWATLACSLLLVPVAHMGPLYTVVALVAGGWFVAETHLLYARAVSGRARSRRCGSSTRRSGRCRSSSSASRSTRCSSTESRRARTEPRRASRARAPGASGRCGRACPPGWAVSARDAARAGASADAGVRARPGWAVPARWAVAAEAAGAGRFGHLGRHRTPGTPKRPVAPGGAGSGSGSGPRALSADAGARARPDGPFPPGTPGGPLRTPRGVIGRPERPTRAVGVASGGGAAGAGVAPRPRQARGKRAPRRSWRP